MKSYYETGRGAIDGGDLKRGFQDATRRTSAGSRPFGMYTPDSVLIAIGRGLIAGKTYGQIASECGVSKKTVERFRRHSGIVIANRAGYRWGKGFQRPLVTMTAGRLTDAQWTAKGGSALRTDAQMELF